MLAEMRRIIKNYQIGSYEFKEIYFCIREECVGQKVCVISIIELTIITN